MHRVSPTAGCSFHLQPPVGVQGVASKQRGLAETGWRPHLGHQGGWSLQVRVLEQREPWEGAPEPCLAVLLVGAECHRARHPWS